MSVSAWPYTQADLAEATHTHELPDRPTTTLNLDYKQMGLGGNNSWSKKARPLPQYRLRAPSYTYGFTLRPYRGESESLEAAAHAPIPRIE
jgi:beta-galactosidase